jgi:hypothetical protein
MLATTWRWCLDAAWPELLAASINALANAITTNRVTDIILTRRRCCANLESIVASL